MPVQAFQLLRDLQQARHHRLAVARFLQFRLALDGLRQRYGIGRIVGHQLAELVDLAVGHLQHAPDVAQHRAGLQFSVRDDLGDAIGAVLVLDVTDHLVAAVLAEVDVEVGHRHAFGVEEPLEQQAEPQGIEIGDGERPGDDGARARATAGSNRDAAGFGPFDEVGHDQEVARILHLRDDIDLEGQALFVVGRGEAGRRLARCKTRLQASFRLRAKLSRFKREKLGFADIRLGLDVSRQDRLASLGPECAPLGDLDGIGESLGEIREQLCHLIGGLEEMLARQPSAIILDDVAAFRDAKQGVMGFVVVRRSEIDFVGRDDRQRARIGEFEQRWLGFDFVLQAVALDLDVETIAEDLLERLQPLHGQVLLVLAQGLVDGAVGTTGQRDQPRAPCLAAARSGCAALRPRSDRRRRATRAS